MEANGTVYFAGITANGSYPNSKGEEIPKWKAYFSETNVIGMKEIICAEVGDYFVKKFNLTECEKCKGFSITFEFSGIIYVKAEKRGHFNTCKVKEMYDLQAMPQQKENQSQKQNNPTEPVDDLPF